MISIVDGKLLACIKRLSELEYLPSASEYPPSFVHSKRKTMPTSLVAVEWAREENRIEDRVRAQNTGFFWDKVICVCGAQKCYELGHKNVIITEATWAFKNNVTTGSGFHHALYTGIDDTYRNGYQVSWVSGLRCDSCCNESPYFVPMLQETRHYILCARCAQEESLV